METFLISLLGSFAALWLFTLPKEKKAATERPSGGAIIPLPVPEAPPVEKPAPEASLASSSRNPLDAPYDPSANPFRSEPVEEGGFPGSYDDMIQDDQSLEDLGAEVDAEDEDDEEEGGE